MLVFIDESGDPGFKIKKGSSPHFVIALILFQEELDAEEAALAIKKLRKEMKHSDKFEFKSNKSNRKHVLIQLADMVAGSIRRYFDKVGSDWNAYRKILHRKEIDVWEFK